MRLDAAVKLSSVERMKVLRRRPATVWVSALECVNVCGRGGAE